MIRGSDSEGNQLDSTSKGGISHHPSIFASLVFLHPWRAYWPLYWHRGLICDSLVTAGCAGAGGGRKQLSVAALFLLRAQRCLPFVSAWGLFLPLDYLPPWKQINWFLPWKTKSILVEWNANIWERIGDQLDESYTKFLLKRDCMVLIKYATISHALTARL